MENETLKEMSPATILVWAAYTVFVIITVLAKPTMNIPFTTLRLIPAITMVLLVAGVILGVIDLIKITKKQKVEQVNQEEVKQTDTK